MGDVLEKERQALDPKLASLLADETKDTLDASGGGFVFCTRCSGVVARSDAGMEINGSHEHFCTNPHGFEFHLVCYQQALGCAIAGQPTAADSWFAGYSWRFASCSGCAEHLGWLFETEGTHFYGLISDRIQREN